MVARIEAPGLVSPKGHSSQSAATRKLRHFVASALDYGLALLARNGAPNIVVGNLYLAGQPSVAQVKQTVIVERLMKIAKFRCTLERTRLGWFNWVEQPPEDIDLDYHFLSPFTDQTKPVTNEQFYSYLQDLYLDRLDVNRPLWKVIYVSNLECGRSVLVWYIDHAIGDGMSLVQVLLGLLDREQEDGERGKEERKEEKGQVGKINCARSMSIESVHSDSSASTKASGSSSGSGSSSPATPANLPTSKQALVTPTTKALHHRVQKRPAPKIGLWDQLRLLVTGTFEGLTQPTSAWDARCSINLKDPLKVSPRKLLASSTPISLDRIKAIKYSFPGATLNDILASVLSMTVRAALEEHRAQTSGDGTGAASHQLTDVRATFPINLRGSSANGMFDADDQPCNVFAFGNATLALDFETPGDCVRTMMQRFALVKNSPSPYVQYFLNQILSPLLPARLFFDVARRIGARCSMYLSNVPAPQKLVHLLGHELDQMSFFLFAPIGCYFGILSYNGQVTVNVAVDEALAIKPDVLCRIWNEQFVVLEQYSQKKND